MILWRGYRNRSQILFKKPDLSDLILLHLLSGPISYVAFHPLSGDLLEETKPWIPIYDFASRRNEASMCCGWGAGSLFDSINLKVLVSVDCYRCKLSDLIWYHVSILYVETFAMLGALAWQVTHSNEKFFCCLEGDRMGNFFSPGFSLLVCVSLSALFSLHPFLLEFSIHRVPDSYTTCSILLSWWWKPCNWSLLIYYFEV